MSISERKKKILGALVDEYIKTAEPVGSKAIASISGLGCSSATIRNELAELTALGYLPDASRPLPGTECTSTSLWKSKSFPLKRPRI